MAAIVLGIGTSHSPMLSAPPEYWSQMGRDDVMSPHLVSQETGEPISYDDLLRSRKGAPHAIDESAFVDQWSACQRALAILAETIREVSPDVLVIVSADQRELLFDDNMPMLQIYWGETIKMVPRFIPPGAPEVVKLWNWGYGDEEMDLPVDSQLGRYLIDYLVESRFDIAHARYLREDLSYGGVIGPAGYVVQPSVTPPKIQGIGHGWTFVVKRLLDNKPIPMVPVMQNATFPPNMPTPARCVEFGRALRLAIETWDSPKRVAVIASGGLSHFVTDQKVDRLLINAVMQQDESALAELPRERLNSASAEIRSWITVAAACSGLTPELVDYVPVYRSPAGTGGGWGFMRWV